jgi:hypothetical protein
MSRTRAFGSHLLITLPSESGALEGFVIKKCEESIHLAMLVCDELGRRSN